MICYLYPNIINIDYNSNMPIQNDGDQQYSQQSKKKIGNYLIGKTIGQGTFNKVKIARHTYSKEQVAIKLIEKQTIKSKADQNRLINELKILRKARHPNITQLYQILQDHRYYYIVTQYADRGEIFDHIVSQQKLTQFEASKYLQQILNAIEYLQEMGIAHRDLKPQNILLDYKYNIKVIDFGLSNVYSRGETLKTACGSPCYAAPQVLFGVPYDPSKVDIWSAGVILYAMCFGYLPFDSPQQSEVYEKIQKGEYQIPQHASDELISLLSIMLKVNSKERATIDQIRRHNFCKFSPNAKIMGIVPGLSVIPYEEFIQHRMNTLGVDTHQLKHQIINNKHTHLTSTYYLLLQQSLRQKNSSLINYYSERNNTINRYKLIEKVKQFYDKMVCKKMQKLQKSRKSRLMIKSEQKKRSKSVTKKMKTGFQTMTKFNSRQLYASPQKRDKLDFRHSNTKSQQKTKKKQLKRS